MNPASVDKQMVHIPAGFIALRDDRIDQAWNADVNAFMLSVIPVTQALYEATMGSNPSTFIGPNLPVETVSWMDAVHFCNALSLLLGKNECYRIDIATNTAEFNLSANGYRLPTEAEWQFACQTGTSQTRYGALNDIAWYKGNSNRQTQDVGQKSANAWGLYDMLGNVWEWCNDVYDETVYGSYRIIRGGGWCDEERGVLATNRRRSHPNAFRIDDLGFRIACNLSD